MEQYISTNTDKEQRLSSPDELEVEKIFEQIVSKSYLQDLCSLKTVPFNEQEQALVINTKMKWIKISKLVFEKNVFFADKLSMLYTALHPVSSQVVLLLRKHDYLFDLYLGTRDNLNEGSNYGISRETLMKGIQGYLPGIHFEVVNEDIKIECSEYVSCVSGVAALKDDKKENFIQGLERLINSTMSIKNYTALIIADKISNSELNNIKFAYEDLFSALSPLSQNQLTYSENNSYGVNSSVSKGFSFSTSKSVSNTITRGTSWSKSHSVSNTKTERGWSLTPFGVGLNKASKQTAKAELNRFIQEAEKSADVKLNIKINNSGIKTVVKTIKTEMGDLVQVTTQYNKQGAILSQTINKVQRDYTRLRQQTEEVKRSQEELNQTVKSSKSIFQDFTDTFMKMAKFNTINLIYDQIVESMSKAVEITKEYNEVLTEFTKVSDLSGESLQNYTEKLGMLGLDVARTTSEMIDGATQWKKSGFTDEESAQLAKIGAEFQNIADEELSASDAANILISAMQGFDLGTQQAEHIVDVINEVELFVTSLNRVNCGEKPMMFVSYNVI
jgi:hypothetical protein